MPDENSIFCKGDCESYNISSPYCIDCAIAKLREAKINKNTIKKIAEILYIEDIDISYEYKNLNKNG